MFIFLRLIRLRQANNGFVFIILSRTCRFATDLSKINPLHHRIYQKYKTAHHMTSGPKTKRTSTTAQAPYVRAIPCHWSCTAIFPLQAIFTSIVYFYNYPRARKVQTQPWRQKQRIKRKTEVNYDPKTPTKEKSSNATIRYQS